MFDIITDSACDLTPETAAKLNIEIVPFYVSLDGEHYRKEGKEIAVRDFYQFMVDNPSAYPDPTRIVKSEEPPTPRPVCPRWRTLRRPSAPMLRPAARCSASASPAR